VLEHDQAVIQFRKNRLTLVRDPEDSAHMGLAPIPWRRQAQIPVVRRIARMVLKIQGSGRASATFLLL
ncbi:MAG: hypothetical protein AAGA47_12365, partial [Pseudomonadota bacterium]